MSIWKWQTTPEQMQQMATNSMSGHIGLKVTEIGPDYVRGTMPVDQRTKQPYGRLHGGANVVLAEELGSFGANMCLDPNEAFAVGLEINANHLRGVTSGTVTGTARPVHLGRSTQVWEIRIETEAGELACISRLTVAVVSKTKV
ncbi:hotdog fold thioesterase [Stagnimonas aquatica]|uniref:Hotdog fold thioesterase n=1 Tax=Stagnimonas aquatica TaxID=2689987 RepID=A0A3N0V1L1_9GAMM|nr:hotdog fold thioesterase [Stagnimonas aquatica]ROH86686.1 hotdog fold thioesterase [Stagnimonas aquatica]